MTEYTPTTEQVREVWGGFSECGGLVIRPSGTSTFLDDRYAEFDRWLDRVRAEAKAEAWDAGYIAGRGDEQNANWMYETSNPYKEQL